MKSCTWAVFALLFTASPMICRATLGETEAQCIAGYGPEFEVQDNLGFDVVGDRAASFHLKTQAGSFLINITFLNGFAALEKITGVDSSHDISEDQKKALLDSESAGLPWSEGATAVCWMSGKLTLHNGWSEIDIATREYTAAQRKLDQEDGAR
jgi:hypothetical protein